MSSFAKDGFHVATDASAAIHITRFMQEESARNIKNLRASIAADDQVVSQVAQS